MGAIRKAVIPAAGLGTRLLPATKSVPKEMMPIVDKPAIQLIVEECVEAGIELVVLITGRYKGAISDHFDISYEVQDVLERKAKAELLDKVRHLSSMVDFVSIRQNRPLGLGHAVGCARPVVGDDEPFAVLLPDDLILGKRSATHELVEVYEEMGTGVLALVDVPPDKVNLYGMIAGDEVGPRRIRCTDMVEKPPIGTAPSNLGIAGRYVLPGSVFRYIAETTRGVGGEIQLTDALVRVMREEGMHGKLLEGTRYDTGDAGGLVRANIAYALERPELADDLRAFMRTLV
jgi:UTP--glucose-1-phosphate uridylyltransferase